MSGVLPQKQLHACSRENQREALEPGSKYNLPSTNCRSIYRIIVTWRGVLRPWIYSTYEIPYRLVRSSHFKLLETKCFRSIVLSEGRGDIWRYWKGYWAILFYYFCSCCSIEKYLSSIIALKKEEKNIKQILLALK